MITEEFDEHAPLVCSRMTALGVRNVRFHVDSFPTQASLLFEYEPDLRASLQCRLSHGVELVDLADVTAVWYRKPRPCAIDPVLSDRNAQFAQRESQYLIDSLYSLLGDRRWLNHPHLIRRADSKPEQLVAARSCGFLIPRSVITNKVEDALRFARSVSGRVVYKAMSGYMPLSLDGSVYEAIYTNIVSIDDIISREAEIAYAPCLFQEYVEKAYEIRVTIVNRHIFAASIDSQSSTVSVVDWRHYDLSNTPYRAITLPGDINAALHSLMDHYELSFGCIDLIVTPNGDYVFLELNPNGQWYWIEALTGLPIANEIACYLGGPSSSRRHFLSLLEHA